jgi:hypothetical protein
MQKALISRPFVIWPLGCAKVECSTEFWYWTNYTKSTPKTKVQTNKDAAIITMEVNAVTTDETDIWSPFCWRATAEAGTFSC